ncbi:hypothetical protein AK812_SmicGene22192 [Symbiodinium microadriaticum]|uniref:Uncharacterized protein n=1 Tax=Symbiodinium microadriaticum TaxID=2951 RepID=A0A1Q9DKD5_SYMMI|nr:hypothetical protein AK812_SmicGene22192 [Symbiodinium microadriaticum]
MNFPRLAGDRWRKEPCLRKQKQRSSSLMSPRTLRVIEGCDWDSWVGDFVAHHAPEPGGACWAAEPQGAAAPEVASVAAGAIPAAVPAVPMAFRPRPVGSISSVLAKPRPPILQTTPPVAIAPVPGARGIAAAAPPKAAGEASAAPGKGPTAALSCDPMECDPDFPYLAARRTIIKSGRPWMGLKELPGNFERAFGTVFEKSRLGLQDHSDLADLLNFFPECFVVDNSSPTGTTVSVKPGNTKVLPPSEAVGRMLWNRQDCRYWDKCDEERPGAMEVSRAQRLAKEAKREEEARKLAAEAQAAAAPKSTGIPPSLPGMVQVISPNQKRSWEQGPGSVLQGQGHVLKPADQVSAMKPAVVVPPMKAPPATPVAASREQQLLQEQQTLERQAHEEMAQLVERMQALRQQVQSPQAPASMLQQIQSQMQQLSQLHSNLQQQVQTKRQQLMQELELERQKRLGLRTARQDKRY